MYNRAMSLSCGRLDDARTTSDGVNHEDSPLLPGDVNPNTIQFYISAVDTLDQEHVVPIHAPEQLYSFSEGDSSIIPVTPQETSTFHVHSNYPHPG